MVTCIYMLAIELLGQEQNIECVKPTRPSSMTAPDHCCVCSPVVRIALGGRMDRWSLVMEREGKKGRREKDEERERERERTTTRETESERVRER